MAKAPTFQLYAGDFLTDVMDWTDEQVGAHIRLLCWSWVNRRGIPRDTQRLTRIAPTAVEAWSVIGEKWVEGPDDTWVNERLESTRANSDAFRDSQRKRSLLAVEARAKKNASKGKPNGKPLGSPMGNPVEGEEECITQERKERAMEIKTLFCNSKFMVLDVVNESLPELVEERVDLTHYRDSIRNWSDAKDEKRTERGWLATFRQWTKTDRDKGQLKKLAPLQPERVSWNPRS